MFKELWVLVVSFARALRGVTWVSSLLLMIITIAALMLRVLLVGEDGDWWPEPKPPGLYDQWDLHDYYGSVFKSIYTMIQVVTLDAWAQNIARPLMMKNPHFAWIFMLVICISTFGLLSLIIGMLVEVVVVSSQINEQKARAREERERYRVLESLRKFFVDADQDKNGMIERKEFDWAMNDPVVRGYLKAIDLDVGPGSFDLFTVIDKLDNGIISIEQFARGCFRLHKSSVPIVQVMRGYEHCLSMSHRALKASDKLENTLDNHQKTLAYLAGTGPCPGSPDTGPADAKQFGGNGEGDTAVLQEEREIKKRLVFSLRLDGGKHVFVSDRGPHQPMTAAQLRRHAIRQRRANVLSGGKGRGMFRGILKNKGEGCVVWVKKPRMRRMKGAVRNLDEINENELCSKREYLYKSEKVMKSEGLFKSEMSYKSEDLFKSVSVPSIFNSVSRENCGRELNLKARKMRSMYTFPHFPLKFRASVCGFFLIF